MMIILINQTQKQLMVFNQECQKHNVSHHVRNEENVFICEQFNMNKLMIAQFNMNCLSYLIAQAFGFIG